MARLRRFAPSTGAVGHERSRPAAVASPQRSEQQPWSRVESWVPTSILNSADPRPQSGQAEVSDWLLPSQSPVRAEPAAAAGLPAVELDIAAPEVSSHESSDGRAALRRSLDAQLEGARSRAKAAKEAVAEQIRSIQEARDAGVRPVEARHGEERSQRFRPPEDWSRPADALAIEPSPIRLALSDGVYDEAGRVGLNSVTFEGLRRLTLTITQAARVIAHREARGGFESLDELSEIPGLPAELLAALRERAYVDEARP